MGKNGFDPAMKRGVQRFEHLGKWATVCYWGSTLETFNYGDRVFFQNVKGEFWLGTIEHDAFIFVLEKPLVTVLEGLSYLTIDSQVQKMHDEDGWFYDQGELPF